MEAATPGGCVSLRTYRLFFFCYRRRCSSRSTSCWITHLAGELKREEEGWTLLYDERTLERGGKRKKKVCAACRPLDRRQFFHCSV